MKNSIDEIYIPASNERKVRSTHYKPMKRIPSYAKALRILGVSIFFARKIDFFVYRKHITPQIITHKI